MAQFVSKCSIWSATSCAAVVFGVNSYVAGKRKLDVLGVLAEPGGDLRRLRRGGVCVAGELRRHLPLRLRDLAHLGDARHHLLAVEPSGKTTRRTTGFGAATVVAGGGSSLPLSPDALTPSQAASPRKPTRSSAATARRRATWPFSARRGGRPGRGGITGPTFIAGGSSTRASLEQAAARRVLGRPRRGRRRRECSREALVERLDGDVEARLERGHERRRLLHLCARLAAQGQRQADDDALGALRRDELGEALSPAGLAARSTTPTGRASVPVASDTATPVRAEP